MFGATTTSRPTTRSTIRRRRPCASGDIAETFRFTYGDYPADEGFAHLATYRAFQEYSIATHFGIPFNLSPELVCRIQRARHPHADEGRQWGVFPPAIQAPADADDETRRSARWGSGGPERCSST